MYATCPDWNCDTNSITTGKNVPGKHVDHLDGVLWCGYDISRHGGIGSRVLQVVGVDELAILPEGNVSVGSSGGPEGVAIKHPGQRKWGETSE